MYCKHTAIYTKYKFKTNNSLKDYRCYVTILKKNFKMIYSEYLYLLRILKIDNKIAQDHIDSDKELYKFGKTCRTTEKRLNDDYYKNIEYEKLYSFKTNFSDRRECLFKYHIKNIKSFKQIIHQEYYEANLDDIKTLLYIYSIIDIEFINKYYNIRNKINNIKFEEYIKDYNMQVEKYKDDIKDELIIEYKHLSKDNEKKDNDLKSLEYKCQKCKKTFSNRGNLNVHIKTVCSENIPLVDCEYCKKHFKLPIILARHLIICKAKIAFESNKQKKNKDDSKNDDNLDIKSLEDKHRFEIELLENKYKALEKNYKDKIEYMEKENIRITEDKKRLLDLLTILTNKITSTST